MDQIQTFEEFLTTQSLTIPIWSFIINLILAAVLAFILRSAYMRFGFALSNRRAFARNFVLIAMTTMLIISIVKSSLALSLGLVGALSIVRFRTAIKEPEELSYLFLAIAIGLGLGANQTMITVLAFSVIVAVIWLRHRSERVSENQNLYLTVSSHNPKRAELSEVVDVLTTNCTSVSLKRFDDSGELLEALFQVEFGGYSQLESTKSELMQLGDEVKVTFLDNRGLGGVG
ncbi:MAG: DUF4956 domain-containing protein [Anaerolineaceae bacterium]|nr:MAG: DUF4956 domain-containing protein [Anaerolineaceae bacterium]